MLQITLMWRAFPQDSMIWCTSSAQLAHLLKDFRANLFLPWHIPSQRFLCTSIQEESDTAFLQDSSGVSVEIFLNPRTGHSTSATLRDVLLLNFPAVRDTYQLRALLSGTPLSEVHGSTRSGLHREGTLIDFAALEVRQDMEEVVQVVQTPFLTDPPMPGISTDRKDGCSRGEADWCGADSEANGVSPPNLTQAAAVVLESPSSHLSISVMTPVTQARTCLLLSAGRWLRHNFPLHISLLLAS